MDSAYVLNTNIHYTNVMNIGVVVACDITQTEVYSLLIKLKGVLQLPGLPLDHVGRGHVKTEPSMKPQNMATMTVLAIIDVLALSIYRRKG